MIDFFAALGLVFVIEGLLTARRAAANMMTAPDQVLRVVGLISAVLGLAVIWLVRG